jgi:pyruvate formate lyase activating enzyme
MQIRGWVKTSLIDYPEHIATVFFTPGCNFRCPMCHNADLVLRPHSLPSVPLDDVWAFLERRSGVLTGITLTGGEPTLQPDLAVFIEKARSLSYDVKLDTNGYRPDVLAALLDQGLLDYVAMDVKAPLERYGELAELPDLDTTRIERSLHLLRESGIGYELRTTVVPGLLDGDGIEAIARWIAGAERYVLQQFRGGETLEPALSETAPYPREWLERVADRVRAHVNDVSLRGI